MPDPLELRQDYFIPGVVVTRHHRLSDKKHVDIGVASPLVVGGARIPRRRNIAHHQGVVA